MNDAVKFNIDAEIGKARIIKVIFSYLGLVIVKIESLYDLGFHVLYFPVQQSFS